MIHNDDADKRRDSDTLSFSFFFFFALRVTLAESVSSHVGDPHSLAQLLHCVALQCSAIVRSCFILLSRTNEKTTTTATTATKGSNRSLFLSSFIHSTPHKQRTKT